MGSKQKPAKKHTSDASSDAAVFKASKSSSFGMVARWRKLTNTAKAAVLLVVLVVIIGGVALIANNSYHAPLPPLPANVDNDYSDTEQANLPLLLEHDYGLSKNDVMHGNLHKELKSFDEAHNVAIAIVRFGSEQRALDAYKIAVSKAPKTTDSSFYVEVMGVSIQAGDSKYGEQMYQKAIDVTNASDLSAADKKVALAHLNVLYQTAKQTENQ